jgi:hypothetical protein
VKLVSLVMAVGCGASHPPPPTPWSVETLGRLQYEVPPEHWGMASGSVENRVMMYAGGGKRLYNVVIQTGPLFTLDWWRGQLGPDPAVAVTSRPLCGGAAQLAEHTDPGPVVPEAPGTLGRPLTTVAMFGEVVGERFAAQWLVAAANRERYRADEGRFFASFRCR